MAARPETGINFWWSTLKIVISYQNLGEQEQGEMRPQNGPKIVISYQNLGEQEQGEIHPQNGPKIVISFQNLGE